MRHLINAGQESYATAALSGMVASGSIPVPGGGRPLLHGSPGQRPPTGQSSPVLAGGGKSWSERRSSSSSARVTVSFSSAGHAARRPASSQVLSPKMDVSEKKVIVVRTVKDDSCHKYVRLDDLCKAT